MTTSTRTAPTVAGLPGLGAVTRVLRATRREDPQRAERRRVAREIAAFPASRGVGLIVATRSAGR